MQTPTPQRAPSSSRAALTFLLPLRRGSFLHVLATSLETDPLTIMPDGPEWRIRLTRHLELTLPRAAARDLAHRVLAEDFPVSW